MTKRDMIGTLIGISLIIAYAIAVIAMNSGCVTATKPPPSCEAKVVEVRDQLNARDCSAIDFQVFQGTKEITHLLLVYECPGALEGVFLIDARDKENVEIAQKTFKPLGQCTREDGILVEVFLSPPSPIKHSKPDNSKVSTP